MRPTWSVTRGSICGRLILVSALLVGGVLLSGASRVHAEAAIKDLAGNGLDGENSGSFPSGDGVQGGDFIATFRINAGPVATADEYSASEDIALEASTVLSNDDDSHGGMAGENNLPLTAHLVSPPQQSVSFNLRPDGTFNYRPSANFFGTDSFTYRAKDKAGGTSNVVTVTVTVDPVNDGPIASIDASPLEILVGQAVLLDGSDSFDPEGEALGLHWDFGDGSSSSDTIVAHNYAEVGSFTVVLKVTDSSGAWDTAEVVITVKAKGDEPSNYPPRAAVAVDPEVAEIGEPVLLDASSSFDPDGEVASYLWEFADGRTETGAMAICQYSSEGVFGGVLTVFDDKGAVDSVPFKVVVLTNTQDGGGQLGDGKKDTAIPTLFYFKFRSVFEKPRQDAVKIRVAGYHAEAGESLSILVGQNRWGGVMEGADDDLMMSFDEKLKFKDKSTEGQVVSLRVKGGHKLMFTVVRSDFEDDLDYRPVDQATDTKGRMVVPVQIIRTMADGSRTYHSFDVPVHFKLKTRAGGEFSIFGKYRKP